MHSAFRKTWKCTECSYGAKLKCTVLEHVETHLRGFNHQCPFCEKICKTRNALKVHAIRKHNFKINTQYPKIKGSQKSKSNSKLVEEKKNSGPLFPHQSKEIQENIEILDDSSLLIKSEHDDIEENKITNDVKGYQDPINISIHEGEKDHQFGTDTDAAVSSFSNIVSNVNDRSIGSVSQEKIQDYETFKIELNRQCEKLMMSFCDSSFRQSWKRDFWVWKPS